MIEKINKYLLDKLSEGVMQRVRHEYTVMPRFGFHQPLDYLDVTLPPAFEPTEKTNSSGLSIPGPEDRFGYSPDDTNKYLEWGRYDHNQLMGVIDKYRGELRSASILDFGCSSGRVLRHFDNEHASRAWKLYGCDIQARAIEWIRRHFPKHFNVVNSSTLPHLPYEDGMFDVIYGFSVFTHIKYRVGCIG